MDTQDQLEIQAIPEQTATEGTPGPKGFQALRETEDRRTDSLDPPDPKAHLERRVLTLLQGFQETQETRDPEDAPDSRA